MTIENIEWDLDDPAFIKVAPTDLFFSPLEETNMKRNSVDFV